MTTIVKTANASDFLAIVPRLVGFQPRESVVFVAFQGNRTCGAMRFDLPDASASRFYRRIATTLVGMLSKLQGVDAVVPVVYTDDEFGERIPAADFIDAILQRLRFSGFSVRDALCVAADGWGSYLDPDRRATARPLAAIAASRVLDSVPESDRHPLGDIETWVSLPDVAEASRLHTARALETLTESMDAAARATAGEMLPSGRLEGVSGTAALRVVLDDIPAVLEEIVSREPEEVDPLAAAFVIAISRSPAIRDVVMLQWAFDIDLGDRVLDDADRFARGDPADSLATAPLMLGRGRRPDPERVERGIATLKRVTALAPEGRRAPLFCMLAWLNWAVGRSSVAGRFVVEAEWVDPRYGLAELLRTMLDNGILPEWAFDRSD